MSLHVKVAGAWQEVSDGAAGGGMPWAQVSGGTVTTVTDAEGTWAVHTFTANGTLTVDSPGLARVMLLGGGSGSGLNARAGSGGDMIDALFMLPSGAQPVVVGAGSLGGNHGAPSSLGSLVTAVAGFADRADAVGATGAGGTVALPALGRTSDITGTPVVYGQITSAATRANFGEGANSNATASGSSGIVIVRVLVTPAPPLPSAGGWAKVSGGTVTEVTNADGSIDEIHTFTATGTLTVDTPGYARCLIVGGGSANNDGVDNGGGGSIVEGYQLLPSGAVPVVVGAAISGTSDTNASIGNPSSLGTVRTGYGYARRWAHGATNRSTGINAPYSSDISGTAQTYASGAATTSSTLYGDGTNGVSKAGVVIVRVQKSAPTVSGIVATGGTVTEYVGDGTNGVLGQRYKVHTFTADGTFTVTQGGKAKVLVCGPGAGGTDGSSDCPGGGGGAEEVTIDLSTGALPVVVGPATAMNGNGAESSIAGVRAGGGMSSYPPAGAKGPFGAFRGDANGATAGGGALGPGSAGGVPGPGLVSSITGTSVEYGKGGKNGVTATLPGQGGTNRGPGSAGVVIVRYEIAG